MCPQAVAAVGGGVVRVCVWGGAGACPDALQPPPTLRHTQRRGKDNNTHPPTQGGRQREGRWAKINKATSTAWLVAPLPSQLTLIVYLDSSSPFSSVFLCVWLIGVGVGGGVCVGGGAGTAVVGAAGASAVHAPLLARTQYGYKKTHTQHKGRLVA